MVDNESTTEQVPDEQEEQQGQEERQEEQQEQEEEKFQCDVEIAESGAWKKKIQVKISRQEIGLRSGLRDH